MATKKPKPPVARTINYQARQVVYNVYTYFKERKLNPGLNKESKQLSNVLDVTAEATGVSRATVTRVINESKLLVNSNGEVRFKPDTEKKHSRQKRINIDETMEATIRRKVLQYYKTQNQVPSIRKLNTLLKEEKILSCSNEFLRMLLHKLGFTNSDSNDDSQNLVEHKHIQKKRQTYLREIRKHRDLKTPVFFINEFKWWETKDDFPDLISLHVSGSTGFIDDTKLMIFSKSTSQLNKLSERSVYDQWLKKTFLPNVPKNSVIILNSPYVEKTETEKVPSSRRDLEEWLTKNNIEFERTAIKSHLHELVEENFEKYQCNLAKSLLQAKATILFLPENHHDLNPVRLAWEEIKEEAEMSNAAELYINLDQKTWMSCLNKVCENEREYGDTAEDDQLMELKNVKQEAFEDDNCQYEISMESDH